MIREAGRADVDTLAELHLATVTAAYADIFPSDSAPPLAEVLAGEYGQLFDRGDRVWVWIEDGSAVGSVALVCDAAVPAGRRIERFHVHPDHQGRGIGRRLYDRVLEQVGGPPLNLWVLEANTAARAIYERWGWTLVSGRTLPNEPPHILDVLYELGPRSFVTDP